jgi:transposase
LIKTVRQQTRRKYSAEDKIRVVLEGLRGDHSVAELCRREGVSANVYYVWLREFMEAGKARPTRLERSARPAHCRTN